MAGSSRSSATLPAVLLGKSLAPRIARMHEQTLYKLDRSRHYTHLDPVLMAR